MTLPQKDSPVLLDRGIQEVQNLVAELQIFDNVFPRAYKRAERSGNTESSFPAVYKGAREYLSVLPDDTLGNYCFFEVDDPQVSIPMSPNHMGLRAQVSLIAWFNMESLYTDDAMMYSEEVKELVMRQLSKKGVMQHSSAQITNVYEKPENIFRYSIKQIDAQYLMHPYHAFRIEFTLIVRETCLGN